MVRLFRDKVGRIWQAYLPIIPFMSPSPTKGRYKEAKCHECFLASWPETLRGPSPSPSSPAIPKIPTAIPQKIRMRVKEVYLKENWQEAKHSVRSLAEATQAP